MNQPPIVLASASPRRSELLASLGLDFTVAPSTAQEIHDPTLPLAENCLRNAEAKAREVAARHPQALTIGADTLVGLREIMFGKPRDLAEAAAMLQKLSGQTHEVITAVCLVHAGRVEKFHDVTRVTFHPLTSETIAEYLRAVPVLDKAGAYGIQERGELLVARIEGSFTNVVGFPAEMFRERLQAFLTA